MRRGAAAIAVSVALLLAGCTTSEPAEPEVVPRPSPPVPSGDGVLRVGTLLPTSGELAFLSSAQVAGVELAVREINEAGGVLGAPVEVFHRNSGDASSATAEASYAELLAHGVDVIVGPASSVLAERILPLAVTDGVALISPAATSPTLSTLDDDGLLLRTVPSSAMQGRAIAQALAEAGSESLATIAFDDAPSLAVASEAAESFEGGAAIAETFTAETDVTALAARIAGSDPDAVVLASPFAPGVPTAALLTALAAQGVSGSSLWLGGDALADYSQSLPAGSLEGVRGVLSGRDAGEDFAARVRSMDPAVEDVRFAAEAYDAVVLAALAAVTAKDDSGASVAFAAVEVSGAGIKCMSFGECLEVLSARPDIDYDGVSGPLALDQQGDPSVAPVRVFTYGVDNRVAPTGELLVE